MSRKIRILHAPTAVGGNPQGLSRAEKEIGLKSVSVSIYQNYLGYKSDIVLHDSSHAVTLLKRLYWAFFKSLQFDVIHYNFGSSFLPFRVNPFGSMRLLRFVINLVLSKTEFLDLKIAHLFGRKIFITFQGDDARQGDYCRSKFQIHYASRVGDKYYPQISDNWKRERIAVLRNYANGMFALNPDLLHVLPPNAEFLPYSHINLSEWGFKGIQEGEGFIPHIVHAPSHREVKGTDILIKALDRLSSEGVPFRFTLVERMSNSEAKKVYETADLLVDQLFAGFYGGLSVELMALGKPVFCYLRYDDFEKMPAEMVKEIPIINVTPDNIYDVLKKWLTTNKKDLGEVGIKSRAYVERWHNPLLIAKQLKERYYKSLDN